MTLRFSRQNQKIPDDRGDLRKKPATQSFKAREGRETGTPIELIRRGSRRVDKTLPQPIRKHQ